MLGVSVGEEVVYDETHMEFEWKMIKCTIEKSLPLMATQSPSRLSEANVQEKSNR